MTKMIAKSARLTGVERDRLVKKMSTMYSKKMSIRQIAEQTGRSYGAVHRMLADAGIEFRGRGGSTRKAKR